LLLRGESIGTVPATRSRIARPSAMAKCLAAAFGRPALHTFNRPATQGQLKALAPHRTTGAHAPSAHLFLSCHWAIGQPRRRRP
jgi:hypothetical protein